MTARPIRPRSHDSCFSTVDPWAITSPMPNNAFSRISPLASRPLSVTASNLPLLSEYSLTTAEHPASDCTSAIFHSCQSVLVVSHVLPTMDNFARNPGSGCSSYHQPMINQSRITGRREFSGTHAIVHSGIGSSDAPHINVCAKFIHTGFDGI